MRDSKSFAPGWLPVLILGSVLLLVFADFAPMNTRTYLLSAQKSKAQLGCARISSAIEAYVENNANTKHELPTALRDLLQPPFGVTSFLDSGETDLLDPWGNPYRMEIRNRSDGTDYVFVFTTTPDGTLISQFGIGPNAQPRY